MAPVVGVLETCMYMYREIFIEHGKLAHVTQSYHNTHIYTAFKKLYTCMYNIYIDRLCSELTLHYVLCHHTSSLQYDRQERHERVGSGRNGIYQPARGKESNC